LLRTADGIEFGLLGDKPAAPAATLFVIALDLDRTLRDPSFNRVGHILRQQGFLCVALDAPCHGKDTRHPDGNALAEWRQRLERGDDIVAAFTPRCVKVLDHLVAEGYTDPGRVAVAGTSRGGFLAIHLAAAEPRVRCVAAFAPVTELLALSEFAGMKDDARAKALDVANFADKLAGRPIWICIGNSDQRVGTDRAIAFSRKVVEASIARGKPAAIETHVTTSAGHSVHPTAHAEAAAWIAGAIERVEQVGDRACLFLDDRFVAGQSGLTRTWHQGRPLPEPAITADAWDNWPHLFGSVIYDPREKRYRMWYSSIREGIFYAESHDGRRWNKPKLGLREIDGSKDNNFVMGAVSLPNVLLDPNENDPAARFKLLAWDHAYYNKEPKDDRVNGHTLFRSGDGVHWQRIGKGIPGSLMAPDDRCSNFVTPDTNQVIWDPLAKRYLATFRTYPRRWAMGEFEAGRRRAIGVTTASHITGPWQPIVTRLAADDQDDQNAAAALHDVKAESKWAELYSMPLFVCGNHYIGLLSLIHIARSPGTAPVSNAPGAGRLELAFSHDGTQWHRPAKRGPLIAPSDAADLHPTYAACSEPLEMGNEVWIYYAEANASHPASDNPKSQIRAAAWRRDGFVSLAASGETPGVLTTPSLAFTGSKLLLNAQSEPGGEVRVGLLGRDGTPLKGFEDDACDPVRSDEIAATVSWRGAADLSKLGAQPVRLRITLKKSRLYGFRFAQ
jgi:dienelactone hydrolase